MAGESGQLQAGSWEEAISARDWERAHHLLGELDADGGLDATGLEQLAETARWTRRYEEMMVGLERAADAYERAGEREAAARVAVKLTIEYFQRNDLALAGACLERAEGMIDPESDGSAAGLLLYCRAAVQLEGGDNDGAVETSSRMREMAQRIDDRDLEALALMTQGRAHQLAGRFKEGATLLDQAASRAVAGGLELWTSGVVLCANISASRHRCDIRSASEWSEATTRWCKRNALGYFPGLCRLHMAESLNMRGDFEAAIAEVEPAIGELEAAMPRFAAAGFNELGEIKRRQGDHAEAEVLFERVIELGGDPLPGLIHLRVDQGRPDAALALARDRLEDHGDRRLGAGRAEVLPAASRAAVEAGEIDLARGYVGELEEIAAACDTPALEAALETARGRLARAEGDHGAAIAHLRSARRLWSEVGAPFDCAVARTELARTELAVGDQAAAEVEVQAASAMLRSIGAGFELDRVSRLLDRSAAPAPRRTRATMLFTDIVSSTKLVEALGDDAWEQLLSWHDRALRTCLEESGGAEVKHEGDGLFAAFDDADKALGCACRIQQKLKRHQAEAGFAPSIRIGVHADEVNDRGDDLGGRGVHLAARVMAAAGAGEVLVTEETLADAEGEYGVRERRALEAKGIDGEVDVALIDWEATAS